MPALSPAFDGVISISAMRASGFILIKATMMALLCGCAVSVASGCTGHAAFELIPLRMNDLDPQKPLSSEFQGGECYYDLDKLGRIQLVIRYRNVAWLGPLSRVRVTLSFVLDEPPAGRARTYRLDGESFRGTAQAGLVLHRFRGTYGVAVVHGVRERSLGGSFRCYVKHQSGNLITGWRGNNALLLIGRFGAVRNGEKTRELMVESEGGDWVRLIDPAPAG